MPKNVGSSERMATDGSVRERRQPGSPARAARTKARIADAVITLLAEAGSSRVTHRLVAAAAGVSLAATTYHYATKGEMIADASRRLLDGYVESFRRAALRQRRGKGRAPDLAGFVTKLLTNASGRYRRLALAWCEIILEAARTAEGHAIADEWFGKLFEAWSDLARAMYGELSDEAVVSGIDTAIGLLFITLPLELKPEQVAAVFAAGADPVIHWAPRDSAPEAGPSPPARRTPKARETRERILEGAIALLVANGAGAVTYKAVAQECGLTIAAPAYHFGSIDGLLKAAEAELFARSKHRYRDMVGSAGGAGLTLDGLADLTAAVFVREVTQHGRAAIAIYSIGVESARRLDLRSAVWSVIADQAKAWRRQLEQLNQDVAAFDALRMQAVFIGKQIRALSTGSPIAQLSAARSAFRDEIAAAGRASTH
ncbi:TetR family transcriptional regulator [Sphingomonas sp. NIBR02145]|uniref:TetR/AcrR family transcriptional regulator n=1 Tax=Sphingomonas sp. NIBR02145 TaxID=3014784 RepID=UPI0022B2E56B|nr:TetR family transcriptional regulator [Sphingomonas sp. NIBR02145]WHU04981.1 TetR family transcriptional regulator [Sphingomonas sp. NIBR02145]